MHPCQSSTEKSFGRKHGSRQNTPIQEDMSTCPPLGQRIESNEGNNVWNRNQERNYFEPVADKLEGFGSIFTTTAGTQLEEQEKSPDFVLSQCEQEMRRLKTGLLEVRKNEVVTYWEMYRVQTIVNQVLTDKVKHLQSQVTALSPKPCVRCGQMVASATATAGKVSSVTTSTLLPSKTSVEIRDTRPRTPGAFLDAIEAVVAPSLPLIGPDSEDAGIIIGASHVPASASRFTGIITAGGIKRPADGSAVRPVQEKSSRPSSGSEASNTCNIQPLINLSFRIPKVSAKPQNDSARQGSGEACSGPVEWREPTAVCNSETEQENSPARTDMDIETDTELPLSTPDRRATQLEAGLQSSPSASHRVINSPANASNASSRSIPCIRTSSVDSGYRKGETGRPELSKLLSSPSTLRTQAASETRQRKSRYQDERRRSGNGRCDSQSNRDRDRNQGSRAQSYSGNLITVQDSNANRDAHKSRFWNAKSD